MHNNFGKGLPILDLALANNAARKSELLAQLHDALFKVGFLYVTNHGVPAETIHNLVSRLPVVFDQPPAAKSAMSKLNSPHFLGYSGYAEEVTLGARDLREQFDYASELPVIWNTEAAYSELFWRLHGPNQWPSEDLVPGFRRAYTEYHDALAELSYRVVHLVEEAFGIPVGTFDAFFSKQSAGEHQCTPPQHRIKLVKYPPITQPGDVNGQGVGAHKDSSGWLTFLLQVGNEKGLEVLDSSGTWMAAPPIDGTFVVNFGNAFEAATDGAVKATVHRVIAPASTSKPRFSVPFFMGLPLNLTLSRMRSFIPAHVKQLRAADEGTRPGRESAVSSFLDPRWDSLGESQLRKWVRSHQDVGRKFYGDEVVDFYLK